MIRILALLLVFLAGEASAATVNAVRLSDDSVRTRVVLEISKPLDYKIFLLDNPRRIVIDLPPLEFPNKTPSAVGVVNKLRFGQFSATQSRVVLDLSAPALVARQFILPPASGFPHRLVIDLTRTDAASFAKQVESSRAAKRQAAPPAATAPRPPAPTPQKKPGGKKTIVIDAGHGGVDPGALGRKVREKKITLAFARELAAQLRATKKYRVYLTRSKDIFIPLRQRVRIAQSRDADLFISIHADAAGRKQTRGFSIYTLSETASDKEAAALARRENQSDIIAGVDFSDYPDAAGTLLALAQRETKNLSVCFAGTVTKHAKRHTRLLQRPHRFAGFRVLKAPDVPSVLIELGFLTNRQDEKQLRNAKWRREVAGDVRNAIEDYFSGIRKCL